MKLVKEKEEEKKKQSLTKMTKKINKEKESWYNHELLQVFILDDTNF